MRSFPPVLVVLAWLIIPAQAQDYVKAFAAYERGDYAVALAEFRPLAERGNVLAQYKLGLMYVNGSGVERDYAQAISWFHRAAILGYGPAQASLGVRFEKGQGVKANYVEAAKWYRYGAEQGDANAQYRLGRLHVIGRGVRRDYTEALALFSRAADQGVADAATAKDMIAARLTPQQLAEAARRTHGSLQ